MKVRDLLRLCTLEDLAICPDIRESQYFYLGDPDHVPEDILDREVLELAAPVENYFVFRI